MKVLGIGETVIDNAHMVDETGAILNKPTQHVGGPVLIGLMLLSRLGIDCTYMTTIGRDRQAEKITAVACEESIQLIPMHQEQTKQNTILINAANGSRKKVRGSITHPYIEGLDKRFLEQFDLIILDRHEKIAFYEVMLKKKKETKVLIDPSTEVSKFTLDMIKYADYPILPIEALRKIDANIDRGMQKLHNLCKRPIVITAGEHGSIIFDGKRVDIIPAINVKAVDVNGAGDIYRGGFAYGVIQGWNLKKSAEFANLIAAMQCTKLGNATAVPTKEEILKSIKTHDAEPGNLLSVIPDLIRDPGKVGITTTTGFLPTPE